MRYSLWSWLKQHNGYNSHGGSKRAAILLGGKPMNKEGYPDPTAEHAIANVEKEKRRKHQKNGHNNTGTAKAREGKAVGHDQT